MKLYGLLIVASLIWGCGKPGTFPNDINRYNHQGKVKRLIVLSFQGDLPPQDTSDFYSRVLYDFNEDGYISRMQSVVSMKRHNLPHRVYNYEYLFKEGKKSGWLEENVNDENDKGFGEIEWTGERKIEERGYSSDSVLTFKTATSLTADFKEQEADFRYYTDTSTSFHMVYRNIYQNGDQHAIVEENLLTGESDTVFFDVREKDEAGNPVKIHMRYASQKPGRYILRQFHYY
jgi:hypothetical protein